MYALGRSGTRRTVNIWPGFVDGLATLLMVVIFVLMVFMVAQYFLSTALTGRDEALARLQRQVAELADILSLERAANADLRLNVTQLSDDLQASLVRSESLASQLAALGEERDSLQRVLADSETDTRRISAELENAYKVIEADKDKIEAQLMELAILQSLRDELNAKLRDSEAAGEEAREQAAALASELGASQQAVAAESAVSEEARRQVELLNRQVLALRQQLASLQEILDAAEADAEARQVQITQLTEKLNLALATKVQELKEYRSEFFGRLRQVLGDQPGIRIVGDRFVFQSEVLFASGEARLGEAGQGQMESLAKTLREVSAKFPEDIDWILRVDGHTDKRPIRTAQFASNWELSSARAISVVNFLIGHGIAPHRLAATGFGEFQPLDEGQDEIAYRRNRRIELKLTER